MGIFPQVKGGRGDESDAERERPQIERESVTFARGTVHRLPGNREGEGGEQCNE